MRCIHFPLGDGKPLHVVVAVGEVGEEGEEEAETCGDGEGAWQTWGVASAGACPPGEEGVFWEEGVHSSCWEEVPSGDRVASGTGKTQTVDTTKHKPVVLLTEGEFRRIHFGVTAILLSLY